MAADRAVECNERYIQARGYVRREQDQRVPVHRREHRPRADRRQGHGRLTFWDEQSGEEVPRPVAQTASEDGRRVHGAHPITDDDLEDRVVRVVDYQTGGPQPDRFSTYALLVTLASHGDEAHDTVRAGYRGRPLQTRRTDEFWLPE